MVDHMRTQSAAALLAGLSLFVAGCGQSGPSPSERADTDAHVSQPAAPVEREMAEEPIEEPADKSDIELTTAESPIRAPDKPAVPPEADKAAADTAAPAELPPQDPRVTAPLPLDNVATADLTMPAVKLTEHHAATCLVKVGDRFPDVKLPDISGHEQSLAELAGGKLALVVFWNGREPTALEQLSDLVRYHQPRLGGEGLAIVAINTGDSAQLAGELAKQAGATFPVLVDADGAVFKQVATAQLPRSYLVDPQGQILWFDLEYSATTRRDMVQAIRVSLAQ